MEGIYRGELSNGLLCHRRIVIADTTLLSYLGLIDLSQWVQFVAQALVPMWPLLRTRCSVC